jgi:uncharacterized protein (TIGR03435 family)
MNAALTVGKNGAKLEPQKVPVDVLVIDHIERPEAN